MTVITVHGIEKGEFCREMIWIKRDSDRIQNSMEIREMFGKGMTFDEYHGLFENMVKMGKTTAPLQPAKLVTATKLNFARSKRILKHIDTPEKYVAAMATVESKMNWLLIVEPWCGDCANIVPMIANLSLLNPGIELRIFLRDQHPELTDQYQTDGKKIIPKLVCFDEDFNQLGTWDGRPTVLQELVNAMKTNPAIDSDELKKQVQLWYLKDLGTTFFREFCEKVIAWQPKESVAEYC